MAVARTKGMLQYKPQIRVNIMALTIVTVAMAPLSIPQLAMMEGWTAIKKASVMKEVAPATSSVRTVVPRSFK